MRFVEGKIFEATFQSPAGQFQVAAEIRFDGVKLILDGLAIYPESGDFIAAGTGPLFTALRQIEKWAREDGFESIDIVAKRVSGANPGRIVRLERELR